MHFSDNTYENLFLPLMWEIESLSKGAHLSRSMFRKRLMILLGICVAGMALVIFQNPFFSDVFYLQTLNSDITFKIWVYIIYAFYISSLGILPILFYTIAISHLICHIDHLILVKVESLKEIVDDDSVMDQSYQTHIHKQLKFIFKVYIKIIK